MSDSRPSQRIPIATGISIAAVVFSLSHHSVDATTVVYVAGQDYIVVASDGYGLGYDDAHHQTAANEVDGDPIRKLYSFGKGGVLIHYDAFQLAFRDGALLRVDLLINYFLGSGTAPDIEKACPEMPTADWNHDDAVRWNAGRLVEGLRACWSPADDRAPPVRFCFLYFPQSGGGPRMIQYRIEAADSTTAPESERELQSLDDWNLRKRYIGMYGENRLIYRLVWGADPILMGESIRPRIEEIDAMLSGQKSERVLRFRHYLVAVDKYQESLRQIATREFTCSHDVAYKREDILSGLALRLQYLDLSEPCAELIASTLVKSQLNLMELPTRSTLEIILGSENEPIVWQSASGQKDTLEVDHGTPPAERIYEWEMIAVRPGADASWQRKPRVESRACATPVQ